MNNNIIYNEPFNKIFNETDVREKYILPVLISKVLGVSFANFQTEVPIRVQLGREIKIKNVDYVVYKPNKEVSLIIEAKSPNEKLEKWIGQVDSYAFELGAPISILTNFSKILVRTYFSENKRQTSLNADIKQLEKTNYKELLMLLHHMSLIFPTKNEGINDNEADTVRLQRACSRTFNALDRKQRTDLLDRIMYDDNNVMLLNQRGNVAISVIFVHSKREVSIISDNNKEVIISASSSDLSLANVKDAVINEGLNIGVDPLLTETFAKALHL